MSQTVLQIGDFVLFSIHLLLIVINMFGWIFRKTRKIQLVTILATSFSWFVMGIWYGWGYCLLTDWEWDIKRQLGETNLPPSFIYYLSNKTFGLDLAPAFLDSLTVVVFASALIAGITVNIIDFRRNKFN